MSRRPPLGEPRHEYRGYFIHEGYDSPWEAYTERGTLVASGATLPIIKAEIDRVERYRIPGDRRIP